MSFAILGPEFDIHGGGLDLMFPHHENEIAQSVCATGGGFARLWMHNEMLLVEGRKMSKSLGNFFTVRDLLDKFDAEFAIENIGPAIRLRLLEGHYRSPIDSDPTYIEAAAVRLDRWLFSLQGISAPQGIGDLIDQPWEIFGLPADSPVLAALCDDLNTPLAISQIDKLSAILRSNWQSGEIINELADDQLEVAEHMLAALHLLGFDRSGMEGVSHKNWSKRLLERAEKKSDIIAQWIEERNLARVKKDWSRSDQIRRALEEAGVRIKDSPQGTEWELTSEFDPTKLESLL
jgi:cysteinyl-tRNA synthetase